MNRSARGHAIRERILQSRVLGAIDVGTNAVRLQLALAHPDGRLEALHYEREPVRPGERVFESGVMDDVVADRLVGVMRRFAELCQLHGARVRAVATSALREAANARAVLRRIRDQTGIRLEVISGREEARLICLGVCRGRPRDELSLVLDIGGGSTEIAFALGGRPTGLWSVDLGAVRLTEMFGSAGRVRKKRIEVMRAYATQALAEAMGGRIEEVPELAFGCSGTIRAITAFASTSEASQASARELSAAIEKLIAMSPDERLARFSERRADIIVAGGVVLESLVHTLGLRSVVAVERGLRDGILADLQEREI
jgi:exopolyphosphatase/guanosine-5'-triphosphate,3'-diphosphate pyrophosphatase